MTKKEEYRMYIHTHQSNVIKAADLYGSQICNYLNIDKRLLTHQRARIHDMSKFSENEFDGYRQYFYPNDGETKNKELFDKAWECHYKRNDHHWEFWVIDGKPTEMSKIALAEMICDWIAMSMVFGNTALSYYEENKEKINLAPETRLRLEAVLYSLFE